MNELAMHKDTEKAALEAIQKRSVGCQLSHLWSDALFAREQSRKCVSNQQRLKKKIISANHHNDLSGISISRDEAELRHITWDLGSYVRWTVVTAWMAFVRTAETATTSQDLSRNMLKNLPRTIAPTLQEQAFWDSYPWCDVNRIRQERNKFIHKALDNSDLFPDVQLAEDAILTLRNGMKAIYASVGQASPPWIECDTVADPPSGSSAVLQLISSGANEDPQRLRVVYVHGGGETPSTILYSTEDPWPIVEGIAVNVRVPIEAIRIYKGELL
jgi:hypothetical protein